MIRKHLTHIVWQILSQSLRIRCFEIMTGLRYVQFHFQKRIQMIKKTLQINELQTEILVLPSLVIQ